MIGLYAILIGEFPFSPSQVLGSYLLLNNPSIGYVWIMRIFLMIAITLPLIEPLVKNLSPLMTITIALLCMVLQFIMVPIIYDINNILIRFILNETILYVIGYIPIALIGLKIKSFEIIHTILSIAIFGILLLGMVVLNDWQFNPQEFKYPPQSQYIAYGIFMSMVLWFCKPILNKFVRHNFFDYLSINSMWIYLWHIIPVYIVNQIPVISEIWIGRYAFVLIIAIILNLVYQNFISFLPSKMYKVLK